MGFGNLKKTFMFNDILSLIFVVSLDSLEVKSPVGDESKNAISCFRSAAYTASLTRMFIFAMATRKHAPLSKKRI